MQVVRYIFQVAHRVDAEDKLHIFVVPAIQMHGLTKVGIATHENLSKACRETQVYGLITIAGSAGTAGAIAAAIDQV